MKNLLFTSAGDNTNFDELWLDKDRNYDVWVVYYGNNDENFERYKSKVDYIIKRKGDKWQNWHHVYYKKQLKKYERFFFPDDDLILTTQDINKLFEIQEQCSLDICQPSFALGSALGWDINAHHEGMFYSSTNFVENNAVLMTKKCLRNFMPLYSPKLLGFGVDYVFMWANIRNINECGIINKIKCINPPSITKPNKAKSINEWYDLNPKFVNKFVVDENHNEKKEGSTREFANLDEYENRVQIWKDYAKEKNIYIWKPAIIKHYPDSTIYTEFLKRDYSPLINKKHTLNLKLEKSNKDKIAFLFLTRNNLKQPELWYDFLMDGKDRCKVYSHTKERDRITQKFLKKTQIPEQVHTKWGENSLVKATNLLLKNALKDPTNKYFVLVSESCIPIRSFEEVYECLSKVKRSWLFTKINPPVNVPEGYFDQIQSAYNQIINKENLNITKENLTRNSQWMVLNREHAEIIDKYNHEDMWEKFHIADEWYHYNILQYYDKDLINKSIQHIKSTHFSYGDGKESEVEIEKVQKNNVHPDEYNLEQIKIIQSHSLSLFLRKVNENLEISYKDIKIKP